MKQDLVKSWVKMSPSGRELVLVGLIVIAFAAAGIKPYCPPIDESGVAVGKRQLFLELSRQPDVVLIEKGNPLCLGLANGIASRLTQRRIFRREKVADSGIKVIGDNRRAGVRRAIVPYDEFPVFAGLRQDAVDGFPQG